MSSDRLDLQKRELGPGDERILAEATLINLNWNEPRFCEQDVRARQEFSHYTRLVPERGDFGIGAFDSARWAGVAWVLFLPQEDAGYGFVNDRIGELSVCVAETARGAGLGRELLNDVISIARGRGHTAISLSVEEGNPARNLYESLGFADVRGDAQPGTMLLTI